jgi:hypothetical protein
MESTNNPSNLPPFVAPCKAVCISKNDGWWHEGTIKVPGPSYNETVTVLSVQYCYIHNKWFVTLKEYPTIDQDGYIASAFAPVKENRFPLITLSKIVEKESDKVLLAAN